MTTPAETMVDLDEATDEATVKRIEAIRQQLSAAAGRELSLAEVSNALIPLALRDYEHDREAFLEKLRAQIADLVGVAEAQVALPKDRVQG